ncbi:MAG: NAD-dependent epimerase [Deltaproteobacteria bacterium RBG_16_71_12]|nr:MAG: NAD-dependent epimerase [Deltaproteobacteria bacterium RBG_16_71_12]
MKRALVTGGAGFVGSHIADALSERGFEVTIFDQERSPWLGRGQRLVQGDITDAAQVASAVEGAELIYHLAALADLNDGKTKPMETARVNLLGTLNVLEAMRAWAPKARLMFASTIYVFSREGGFYRCSKQACESYIEEYARVFGLAYTVLRYGSLYGPRSGPSNGVYRLLQQAASKGRIAYPGSPDDLREYIHVEDAARLSVDAAAPEFSGRHLVLTGVQGTRAHDLFTMFGEILGKPIEVDYGNEQQGHYKVTPYAFTPRPGHKLTATHFVDMGQGLLQVVEQLHQSLHEQHGHGDKGKA